MKLYDKLMQRKRHGEKLDMKSVTYEVLYQLWWKEDCSDSAIAELYDVQKKKITNLRNKWAIKVPDTIVKEFEERFPQGIPSGEEDSEGKDRSPEAAFLIKKVHELNDLDMESLRLELARRYPIFARVTQEVEFLRTVERIIHQFWVKSPSSV